MPTCKAIEVNGWDWRCLDQVPLPTRSKLEERAADVDELNKSSQCFLLEVEGKPVAFVGLRNLDVIGPWRYLWLVPFQSLRAKHIRPILRLLQQRRLGRVAAHVFSGDERFARLFGFEFHSTIKGVPTYIRNG